MCHVAAHWTEVADTETTDWKKSLSFGSGSFTDPCAGCEGTGRHRYPDGVFSDSAPCRWCQGSGLRGSNTPDPIVFRQLIKRFRVAFPDPKIWQDMRTESNLTLNNAFQLWKEDSLLTGHKITYLTPKNFAQCWGVIGIMEAVAAICIANDVEDDPYISFDNRDQLRALSRDIVNDPEGDPFRLTLADYMEDSE